MTDIRDIAMLPDKIYFECISRPQIGRRPWRFMSPVRDPGTAGVCAAIAVGTVYVTGSTPQSAVDQPQAGAEASPIYGVTIPAGYRDW